MSLLWEQHGFDREDAPLHLQQMEYVANALPPSSVLEHGSFGLDKESSLNMTTGCIEQTIRQLESLFNKITSTWKKKPKQKQQKNKEVAI